MEMRGSRSGGGCCIARYTHHVPNNTTAYDTSKMGRIMLRFRPIAPKPAIGGANSASSIGSIDNNVKSNVVKKKRKTNNATTNKARKDNIKKRKSCSPDHYKSTGSSNVMTTLPLLPEVPDLSPKNSSNSNSNDNYINMLGCNKFSPQWLCFGPSDNDLMAQEVFDYLTAQEVFPSSVTVEGVSDAWLDGNTLGCTDEEKKRRLDEDTCPGFISDGWNRVWWTNKEYKRMVAGDCKEDTWRKEKLVSVKLEMRDKMKLPTVNLYGAFTCRVRVQYGSHTMTVPCDVWRMNNGGGFAWRLDVKAALSLGL